MHGFHQNSWHAIDFQTLATQDPNALAGASFYEAFYAAFFKRYQGWEELETGWRASKERVAAFIRPRLPQSRVLSFGCGLGYVEKQLLETCPGLEVVESGLMPLRWLAPLLRPGHAHIGEFPACLENDAFYGFIYLSAVDYCFAQDEWISLLREVRGRLEPGGRCLVVCASFEGRFAWLRSALREILVLAGLRRPGQFWGYTRSRRDHRTSFENAGLAISGEGFIEDGVYWIEGLKT